MVGTGTLPVEGVGTPSRACAGWSWCAAKTQYLRGKVAAAIAAAVGPIFRPAQGAHNGCLAQ